MVTLYPTGSCLNKFYGTANVHKISEMTNFQYSQLFQTLKL